MSASNTQSAHHSFDQTYFPDNSAELDLIQSIEQIITIHSHHPPSFSSSYIEPLSSAPSFEEESDEIDISSLCYDTFKPPSSPSPVDYSESAPGATPHIYVEMFHHSFTNCHNTSLQTIFQVMPLPKGQHLSLELSFSTRHQRWDDIYDSHDLVAISVVEETPNDVYLKCYQASPCGHITFPLFSFIIILPHESYWPGLYPGSEQFELVFHLPEFKYV
ncbi:hypothetical protein BDQ12DRAFT_724502 [Crucibulum laeve]|uniref:Uncharacterized protein n=1 Tax=Crucibulum laeve TaxID=68775 RepID=A0A5C3LVN0_9AGAR|nr:hypothetical protein BDQ12DRAFT_724502 [Crucibulum laeve]